MLNEELTTQCALSMLSLTVHVCRRGGKQKGTIHPVCICRAELDCACVQAWWNAESIGEYWTMWNLPVHHWMVRHVYNPTRRLTGNRNAGLLVSFFLSAVFHEVLIAVPLHRIKGYAFWGMMGQVSSLLQDQP